MAALGHGVSGLRREEVSAQWVLCLGAVPDDLGMLVCAFGSDPDSSQLEGQIGKRIPKEPSPG